MLNNLSKIKNLLQANPNGYYDKNATDRFFVSPLLTDLGWDLIDPNETQFNFKVPDIDPNTVISYALKCGGKTTLLVDVMPLFTPLKNTSAYKKIFDIALASPADYLAVSNGIEWYLYNVAKDIARFIFCFSINDSNAETQFSYLFKKKIQDRVLDRFTQEISPLDIDEKPLGEMKTRGIKLTDETYQAIDKLKNRLVNNRSERKFSISNSIIIEALLQNFIEKLDSFDDKEVLNYPILKMRIKQLFK